MSLFKLFNFNFLQVSKQISQSSTKLFLQERGFRKSYGRILRTMKARREYIGPDRVRRRNEWFEWNYQAELFAFPRRLHENITEDTLRSAFIHDSYVKKEEEKRKALDMPVEDGQLEFKSNKPLIELGNTIINNYLSRYLSNSFPKLPKEGISALHKYLVSDEVLSHVSFNLGTSELIFCMEYPPDKSTLSDSLKSIVGSIATDNDTARAENFVLDFVCPQLIGKDVFDIWDFQEPIDILNRFLKENGLSECESRLIFDSGRNTIEAIYHVGLYSDKKFLGRGPGETLIIAEEMAAYDALRKIFHVKESERPLLYGDRGRSHNFKASEHFELSEWKSDSFIKDLNL